LPVRAIARRHRETLALRRRQESYVDPYGNEILDGWLRERSGEVAALAQPAVEDLVAVGIDVALLAPAQRQGLASRPRATAT
jgi:hypothetical protein